MLHGRHTFRHRQALPAKKCGFRPAFTTGMDYAKAGKVRPDWQASKPADGVLVVGGVLLFDLSKKL
jgi:hypothetical protein